MTGECEVHGGQGVRNLRDQGEDMVHQGGMIEGVKIDSEVASTNNSTIKVCGGETVLFEWFDVEDVVQVVLIQVGKGDVVIHSTKVNNSVVECFVNTQKFVVLFTVEEAFDQCRCGHIKGRN
jgi:hypothetical protein